MDRQKIKIKSPCSKNFDEMEGEGFKRFCDHCEKHVHNLSDLTRKEALALLKDNADTGLCVVYTFDSSNRVRFQEEMGFKRPPKAQLRGLKRLLAAAAVVPLLAGLPACDTMPDAETVIVDGYQTTTPCDAKTQDSFKPIDLIMQAERDFVAALEDLLGFSPDIEYQVAGEPAIAPDIYEPPEPMIMGAPEPPPEPEILPEPEPMVMGKIAMPEPTPEPIPEPTIVQPEPEMMVLGDMAAPNDVIEALETEELD